MFGCSGVAPGLSATVSWRGPEGAGKSFGTVSWDADQAIRFLTLDGLRGGPPSTAAFPLMISAPSSLAPAPPGGGNPPARPPVETPEAGPYRAPALAAAVAFGALCGWLLTRARGRIPSGIRTLPSPPVLPGGPVAYPALLVAEDPQRVAEALLRPLAARGRVVVASARSGELSWDAGGPVYAAESLDRLDLGLALRLLAREGPTPTLLVVGRCVVDPGGAVGDTLRKLLDDLPRGMPSIIVLGPGEPSVTGVPTWTVSGPPWRAERQG